jgi:hypothetical protein
VKLT